MFVELFSLKSVWKVFKVCQKKGGEGVRKKAKETKEAKSKWQKCGECLSVDFLVHLGVLAHLQCLDINQLVVVV
jgi:hypothetical protein